jgi:hexosaminidase
MQNALLLLPAPRRLTLEDGVHTLAEGQLILLDYKDSQALLSTALRFQRALQNHCGLRWDITGSPAVPAQLVGLALRVHPDFQIPDQGYELSISPQAINIKARDLPGAFYGVCTLIQVVEQRGRHLPYARVVDWPDFTARGVLLDVSRGRVPTMETLYNLVDQLAGWKINQLQLYTEHAFAYRQHPEVWADVTPITGQEAMELDVFCHERFVELVPNQQSFGHLAPWLNHPRYRHLAEVKEGFQTPWGYRQGAFSLCPTDPESIRFLHGLYAELLPHYSSHMFNVGGDETWDLGQGRSQEACERVGKSRVYLDFLLQIYQEVKNFGRMPQFWGDIIVDHPELIPELPQDMIALEWGYEAAHPFDLHGARFAASGIPFYVCPGTSSWCSISGRTDNAIGNLLSAAENGLKHGAVGYLITDWGDYGHWQAWPISYLGLAAGAAYAWSLASNRQVQLAKVLSWHAFRDMRGAAGQVAFDLGNVYRAVGIEPHNSSVLFWILQRPLEQIHAYPDLSPATFEHALRVIDVALDPLESAKMERQDGELILRELRLMARLLRHACRRGILALEDDPSRTARLQSELGADLTSLIADFRYVWLQRNRLGGLSQSMARLEKLREEYA